MPIRRRILTAALLALLALSTILPQPVLANKGGQAITAELAKPKLSPETAAHLQKSIAKNGYARVIVKLNVDYQVDGELLSAPAATAQRGNIQRAQKHVMDALQAHASPHAKRFQYIPYLALSVDAQGLGQLQSAPDVTAIEEDLALPPALAESVALIGATPATTMGYTGQGQTIAILDTGVDKIHPFLNGKVVSEACYSTTDAYNNSLTVCPGGVEESILPGSGVNCSAGDECIHGTHVAGIAAGRGTDQIPFSGVARDANIISVQVFSRFDDPLDCRNGAPCVMSYVSDQILGLERVYTLHTAYNIAAVNMSLGSGYYSTYCDTTFSATKMAIDNLRAVGIATVIAAGNDGYSTAVSSPACISSAISVGSTRDGGSGAAPVDTVSSFSNNGGILELLAPGEAIYSSIPGGGYASLMGTSMAAPHVAGAWAVIKSKAPGASVTDVLEALRSKGKSINDTRNNLYKPRIQVDAALNSFNTASMPTITGFSPSRGPAGTVVEIYGTNFSSVYGARIGTVSIPIFQVVSSQLIRIAIPEGVESGRFELWTDRGIQMSSQTFYAGANPVPYTSVQTDIEGLPFGVTAPADYDRDGRIDLVVSGMNNVIPVTRLYHQAASGAYQLVNAGLKGIINGAAAWGDIDNDNDLDLLLTGNGDSVPVTLIYQNNNGSFNQLEAGLPGLSNSAAAWGDLDNDGDQDLALSGLQGSTDFTGIFINNGAGQFSQLSVSISQVSRGSINWVDVDNDGDQDLFLTGMQGTTPVTVLYENFGSQSFASTPVSLYGLFNGASDWGDYDNDGDLDLLVTGKSSDQPAIKIYRNNGSKSFVEIASGLPPFINGTAAWGDYDNDGDLDVLLSGTGGFYGGMLMTVIYKNSAGTFSNAYVPLEGMGNGKAAWVDIDNDHDLDVMYAGDTFTTPRFFLYRNNAPTANTPPGVPANLTFSQPADSVLSWSAPVDDLTPSAGLTYNLRVGTTPGGSEILSPAASLSDGSNYLPRTGNVGTGTSTFFRNLAPGTYYWAVQAVDASLSASAFAAEQSFTVRPKFSFRAATLSFLENVGFASIEVVLEKALAEPATVDYTLASETAIAGNDFMPISGRLTFATGETKKTIQVEVLNDGIVETDKTFLVSLSNPSINAMIGSPGQTRVTIADEDGFERTTLTFQTPGLDSSMAWGDYDNDGDLDFVISSRQGTSSSTTYITRLYRNDSGNFTEVNAGLPGVDYAFYYWLDFDSDGDMDLFIYGRPTYSSYFARIYRNTAGVFADINAGFPATSWQSHAIGDYDNDGDPDLLLQNGNGTILYQNLAGRFVQTDIKFPALAYGPSAWGDYDNDGDLDLVLCGTNSSATTRESNLYRNDGAGVFTKVTSNLEALAHGTAAWGDFNNDGYLDLLLSGYINLYSGSRYPTHIYQNNNGTGIFTDVPTGLPSAAIYSTGSDWGDYDNDGDLDLLLAVTNAGGSSEMRVYRNDGGSSFTDIQTNLLGRSQQGSNWGDYDNDGDLDLLMMDYYNSQTSSYTGTIYRNRILKKNMPPSAPTNLSVIINETSATLRWDPAGDAQTPAAALTYNLRVGTYPGGENIISPLSNKSNGYRWVPQMGNAQQGTTAVLKQLSPGMTYYWSVQSVDTAFAGSPFSAESSFTIPAPTVSVVSPVVLGESQSTATVQVNLSKATLRTVTVKYSTADGTAAAGSDYQAVSGELTFAAGEMVKTVNVPVLEDSLDEADETIHLVLSEPYNATLGSPSTGTITITDNDNPPMVELAAAAGSANEGNGSINLTVRLLAPSGKTVSVSYVTASGSAAAGSDFTQSAGKVTFASGQTSQVISIPLTDDAMDELDEDFSLSLSAPENASLGSITTGVLTIQDNDGPPSVTFEKAAQAVAESAGTASVKVTLSAPSALQAKVSYQITDGTAIKGQDYAGSDGVLTFAPGQTSQSISFTITDDKLDELDETVNLSISGPENASLGAVVKQVLTIQDNDAQPAVLFEKANASVLENAGTMLFKVILSAPSGLEAKVSFHLADGSAVKGQDYSGVDGVVTFAPGETAKNISVSILEDSLDESDETIQLTLTDPINATVGTISSEVITISDNDGEPVVELVEAAAAANEGDGSIRLTARLLAPSGKPVSVSYTTANGSAAVGSDYTLTTGKVTFAPGVTSQVITVPLIDDTLDEPEEGFSLSLSAPENASLGAAATTALSIQDNDAPPAVLFEKAALTSAENAGPVLFKVILTAPSGLQVKVGYHFTDGSAFNGLDYTGSDGVVTFAPGETAQSISIPIRQDNLDEVDETFQLALLNPENATLGALTTGIIKISDSDDPPVVEFLAGSTAANEDNGAVSVTVRLLTASSKTVSVSYATGGGRAEPGSDYTTTAGKVSFAPGQTSQTIVVSLIDDTLDEPDEGLSLTLSTTENANLGALNTATVIIKDNDAPPAVAFEKAGLTIGEDAGTVRLSVTLSAPSALPVKVHYSAACGTAHNGQDYSGAEGVITFAPGQTSQEIAIAVKDDGFSEPEETLILGLSDLENASLGKPDQSVLTIQDNDPEPAVLFENTTVTFLENEGTVLIKVTLSAPSAEEVSVSYRVTDGTAAVGHDYAGGSGTITFAPGQTSQTIQIQLVDDEIAGLDRTLVIELESPVHALLSESKLFTLIIKENDPAVFYFYLPGIMNNKETH